MRSTTRFLILSVLGSLFLFSVLISAEGSSRYYGVDSSHEGIRDIAPRFLGNKDFDPQNDDWDSSQYLLSVLPTAFYGIALFLLALIVGILWVFWKSCKGVFSICKCCCCFKGKEFVPTGSEDLRMKNYLIGMAVLMILLFTWSTTCLVYNSKISDSIVGDKGLFPVSDKLVDDGFAVVGEITDGVKNIIVVMQENIDEIGDIIQAAPNAFATGPEDVRAIIDQISTTLNDSDPFTVRLAVSDTTTSVTCEICVTYSNNVTSEGSNIVDGIEQTIDELNETIVEATEELFNQFDDIIEGLNDSVVDIDKDIQKYYDDAKDALADAKESTEHYDTYRLYLTGGLYIFPFIGIVILGIALYTKSPFLVSMNVYPFWLSWFFVSLFIGIHFPLAVFVGDGCSWIAANEQTFGGDAGKVRDVCLNGESVDVIFNFTEFLSFRNDIQINVFTQEEIDEIFAYTQLNTTRQELENLDVDEWADASTYGSFDDIDSNIATFNTNYGATITVTRETATSDASYNTVVAQLDSTGRAAYDEFAVPLQLEEQIASLKSDINDDFDEFDAFVEVLKENVTDLAETVNQLDDRLVPIFDAVDDLIDSFSCTFIGDAYVDFKRVICSDLIGSVTYICLFSFLLVICAIPTTFLFCFVSKALKNEKKADKFFANDDFSVSDHRRNPMDLHEEKDVSVVPINAPTGSIEFFVNDSSPLQTPVVPDYDSSPEVSYVDESR